MDAKSLLNAMVAFYAERQAQTNGPIFGSELLSHAAQIVLEKSEQDADQWIGERLADIQTAAD